MKKRKTNIFEKVKMSMVPSNSFDLSHDVKLSFGMGTLVPIACIEAVPGDKFRINTEALLRFAPLIAPVMHRVDVTEHWYFVPNRILWTGWADWITGESEEGPPYISPDTNAGKGTLADYLGYIGLATPVDQSAFPIAAYCKIWDEYYRDQNLQTTETFTPLTAGDNTAAYDDFYEDSPMNRAWEHDYFTSCLPFAQKGDAVEIPLTVSDAQDVYLDTAQLDVRPQLFLDETGTPFAGTQGTNAYFPLSIAGPSPYTGSLSASQQGGSGTGEMAYLDPNQTLKVDVQGDATDINSLRRAFRLQEWLEKNARGGTRYIENLLAHFGVRSSDGRLQRPEYLGGSKSRMVISEVLSSAQTTEFDSDTVINPVGEMAGHGVSAMGGKSFNYYAEEHGWIVGLINVQPTTAYQQGIPRHMSRMDRLDYYWPSFANIGEQEVLNKELYAQGTSADDETFGYIPRYSEYKYAPSRVHGEFKDTLAYWHWGRTFDSLPTLSTDFISCNPRDDQFAVTATQDQQVLAHIFCNVYARRKMPRFGVPTI